MRLSNGSLRLGFALIFAVGCGYVAGSILPFHGNKDCHLLGGYIEAISGPGKPTRCVIAWDNH
ncbi:hypothetical protein GCM10010873_24760 [Cypionkella aquatica]|uniref:Uncharacterized protein n=1 Tax=Cypionkella aquatica TaxID=1756042 RepID=A0AA37TU43_9RHOB|nr:hypothetical protein [Cypionkella aquatica]GLS87502.1 hypothetical protein GCM10010873_24760 [Cypionkella aquatica]